MKYAHLILAAAVVIVASALRFPRLEDRPMHTDESVQALKFQGLLEHGQYRYDPDEYHGPVLSYATRVAAWLGGVRTLAEATEATLRCVPAVFGVGLVGLAWGWRGLLGRGAACWAGLLTALSPALVYYSRYYIHEMLLVFWSGLFLMAGWRYARSPHWGWAALGGAGLGLMHSTKETFVLQLGAAAVATGVLWGRRWRRRGIPWPAGARGWHAGLMLGVAAAVSAVFFTSFFAHGAGLWDSIRTYGPWLTRAEGDSPHVHPWHFYLGLLAWTHRGGGPVWSELLILGLAVAGGAWAWRRRGEDSPAGAVGRWLSVYAVVLTAVYSVIPYKTPWCMLGFLHAYILLAGLGAAGLLGAVRAMPSRVAAAAAILVACGQLGVQAAHGSFGYAADPRNPYVYAHTSPNLLHLVRRMENLARAHPLGRSMVVKVIAAGGDYWPLPWYLRRFERVGWYSAPPEDPRASAVIASPRWAPELEGRGMTNLVAAGHFGLRPAVFLQLRVEPDLWSAYMASPREPED